MGVKLNKETSDIIHVSQMKEAKIAEIIRWDKNPDLIGKICQMTFGHLLFIGEPEYKEQIPSEKGHLVRILKNGETLTITDNE